MKPFFLSFLLFFTVLHAQTYEEYLRSQEEAFSSYKDAYDKEFSSFLSKEWKAYKSSQGLSAYEDKKPKALPKAKKQKIEVVKNRIIIKPKKKEIKKAKVFHKIIIEDKSKKFKTVYINYFGVELELHYDKNLLFKEAKSVTNVSITKAWNTFAKSDYEKSINELKSISTKLQLNDWGKYLLIKKFASGIYSYEKQRNLFTWFALLKMGYDARVAYSSTKVVLLLPVKGTVYSTVYYTINGKKYFALDYYAKGKLGAIKTYEKAYEGADNSIDFSLSVLPRFAPKMVKKSFRFCPFKETVMVPLEYDKNLLEFYLTYPQVSYENYFFALDSELLSRSLKDAFSDLLTEKSEGEALDILLNFVQTAFKYKVDEDQFGKEKVMFSSETIFYPYSDCEDRAIFFSYLVKTLLGMEVVGLQYKNHMATAVKVQEKIRGEYVNIEKRAYIIADPTYVNANVGLSMPAYKGVKPFIISN